MSKFIVGAPSDHIYQALHDAGVFAEDPSNVSRIIIDLKCGSAAKFYLEVYADTKLTDVLLQGGLELVERDAA